MMGIPDQDINIIFFSNYKGKKSAGEFTESMKNLVSGGWLRCSSCWAISIAMLTSSWCPILSSLCRSPGPAEESLSDWMGDRIWSWSCELALIDSSSGGALGQEFNEYSTSQAFIKPCGALLVVAELDAIIADIPIASFSFLNCSFVLSCMSSCCQSEK